MINKVQILGRIGKKESKTTRNGSNMTSLSIATNRKYIDSKGNQVDNTTWHTVYFFNKIADIADKYTEVGDLVYIEGEINNKKIEDANGSRWVYSINGSEIKLLPNGRKNSGQNYDKPKEEPNSNAEDPFDDGLPF